MKEVVAKITSKGQVTIPAEVRAYLGLKTHDKILFIIDEEGTVRLAVPRYRDIAALRGAAGSLPHPLSWQEIREIAREDARDLASEDHLAHRGVDDSATEAGFADKP